MAKLLLPLLGLYACSVLLLLTLVEAQEKKTVEFYIPPVKLPAETAAWVSAKDGGLPENAVQGGVSYERPLYVVRAAYQGALIPGKLVTTLGYCHIAFNGAEYNLTEYEVLTAPPGVLNWASASNGDVLANTIVGGRSEKGELLYVGRCLHNNELTTGKIQPSAKGCVISYGAQEFIYNTYETLRVSYN